MASTRRRSRTGDTPNTRRHQRSVSHATSVVEKIPTVSEELSAIAVIESAQDASPPFDTPVNRSTKGFCKNCGSNIGEYYNSWRKVTGSYYVPTLLGSYRSLLKSCGKQKAASRGTAIEGCTIQPLSCPASSAPAGTNTGTCTDSPIGFTVVDAPAGKRNFRGRDFFKLGRIELRCEVSPEKIIVVQPQEDTAPDLEDLDSPTTAPLVAPTEETMEIDSRPASAQHSGPHHVHPGQHHQPLPQMEGSRHSLPLPSNMRSPTTLAPLHSIPPKALSHPLPSVSPAVRPLPETQYATQPSPRESGTGLTSHRDFPPVASQLRPPTELHQVNGNAYPRLPGEVSLDAIERLQTQISQNSGALAAHTRDIRRGEESFQQLEATFRREFAAQVQRQSIDISRVDEAVARLHLEMQSMRQVLDSINHELAISRAERQRGTAAPLGQPAGIPDVALELMAQQVAAMSHKTTEVDNLRVTVEIMKKKIHHLEQGVTSAPPVQATPQFIQSSHGAAQPQVHTTASVHNQHTATPGVNSPVQTPLNSWTYQSFDPPSASSTPGVVRKPELTPSHSNGWASINVGTKRTHISGVESSHETTAHVPGSPKRQKMAIADHRDSHTPSQTHPSQHAHDRADAENSDSRQFAPPSTLPGQHSIPESTTALQTQQSVYAPYSTQDESLDDSWRSDSQRIIEHRPRGRGRGGGPGSRGGRVRKSMPAPVHQLDTPDWERNDWQGVPESQPGPEGFHNHVAHSGRGIARRGSGGGGGGRGGYGQSDRATSLGSQGVSPGFGVGSPNDPYAHTKKTRTKPIRNADGVLIRKDGRPDMRSQSSAANLRKVHARKEGELSTQGSPTGFTPTNLQYAASADAPDSPSPSNYAHPDHDAQINFRQKHSAIMGKMFPSGVDESRKQHDYAHRVFEEDRDHTARPRTQNHHHNVQPTKSAFHIKKEQFDQNSITDSQSSHNVDVDMDRAEEDNCANVKEQAPGRQSNHDHDAHTQEQLEATQPTQDSGVPMVPETQAME